VNWQSFLCTAASQSRRAETKVCCWSCDIFRREGKNSKAINVLFLIDTGSPNTFLSDKAREALVGNTGCNIGSMMGVSIQSLTNIECHISPHDKHFADVNVLGADFLVKNGLTLKANYYSDICTLMGILANG
jgi:hypothetical protein